MKLQDRANSVRFFFLENPTWTMEQVDKKRNTVGSNIHVDTPTKNTYFVNQILKHFDDVRLLESVYQHLSLR